MREALTGHTADVLSALFTDLVLLKKIHRAKLTLCGFFYFYLGLYSSYKHPKPEKKILKFPVDY